MRYSVGLKTHPVLWLLKQSASEHVKTRYELARTTAQTAVAPREVATKVETTAVAKAGAQEKEKGMVRRC